MARRYDPDRRQRITDAAVRVVTARGIAGLSHRAVAAEADVPLGSTTYHFADLDELLLAAMRQANADWLTRFARWVASVPPEPPLADELVRLVEECAAPGPDRQLAELSYELYFAALRRPVLRPLAAHCLDAMADALRPLVADRATARSLVAQLDGVLLQLLLTDREPDREESRAAFARLVPGTGSRPGPVTG